MPRLLELDDNNTVIAVHTLNLPLRVQLSDRFVVAGDHVDLGWDFHPDSQIFSPPGRRPWLTRLAFRNRFTQVELVSLELAALDNPSAEMAVRQQAASIRVMLASLQAASYIDLDRSDTQAGVRQLEAGGLLTQGRADEILSTEILDLEYHPDA